MNGKMYKLAEKYEALMQQLNFRPHKLRLEVLRTLCMHPLYTDITGLTALMSSNGIAADKEKVRMVIKRLNEAGFLHRKQIAGKNKYIFCLKSYDEVEAEVSTSREGKHQ
ncbi:MAG TPA: hypothetical protein VK826_17345 [Bacteroidia bacterium]|nr:hypothetical protein [Bacteroidia bacterium]